MELNRDRVIIKNNDSKRNSHETKYIILHTHKEEEEEKKNVQVKARTGRGGGARGLTQQTMSLTVKLNPYLICSALTKNKLNEAKEDNPKKHF